MKIVYQELEESKKSEILKIHKFLPKRHVIFKSYSNTKNQGWIHDKRPDIIGKKGIVIQVHENVLQAIYVQCENGDRMYWHYQDLLMMNLPRLNLTPVLFDPNNLDV